MKLIEAKELARKVVDPNSILERNVISNKLAQIVLVLMPFVREAEHLALTYRLGLGDALPEVADLIRSLDETRRELERL